MHPRVPLHVQWRVWRLPKESNAIARGPADAKKTLKAQGAPLRVICPGTAAAPGSTCAAAGACARRPDDQPGGRRDHRGHRPGPSPTRQPASASASGTGTAAASEAPRVSAIEYTPVVPRPARGSSA